MKLFVFATQVATLSLGFFSNRADALAGAAIFSVLCVVVVFIREPRRQQTARGWR
jgi:hypothetical protein